MNVRAPRFLWSAPAVAMLAACAAQPASEPAPPAANDPPAATGASAPLLASSVPAAGSTVASPVNQLRLHFARPARLDEVTVAGPDGLMPMMVHAVGEVADYSVPLPALGPGTYKVKWKATSAGRAYEGDFTFTAS